MKTNTSTQTEIHYNIKYAVKDLPDYEQITGSHCLSLLGCYMPTDWAAETITVGFLQVGSSWSRYWAAGLGLCLSEAQRLSLCVLLREKREREVLCLFLLRTLIPTMRSHSPDPSKSNCLQRPCLGNIIILGEGTTDKFDGTQSNHREGQLRNFHCLI